jgi:hypothetical protein
VRNIAVRRSLAAVVTTSLALAIAVLALGPAAVGHAAAIDGPGVTQRLGSDVGRHSGPTLLSDNRRFVAFHQAGGQRERVFDARRRGTFDVPLRCHDAEAAGRHGELVFSCSSRHLVVLDAVHRRVHRLPELGPFDDVAWPAIAVGRRWLSYGVVVGDAPPSSGPDVERRLVNWRTGAVRRVDQTVCAWDLDARVPRPVHCDATTPHLTPSSWFLAEANHNTLLAPGSLWLFGPREPDGLRLSDRCELDCQPTLVGGWSTWLERGPAGGTVLRAHRSSPRLGRGWRITGGRPHQIGLARTLSDVVVRPPGGRVTTLRLR